MFERERSVRARSARIFLIISHFHVSISSQEYDARRLLIPQESHSKKSTLEYKFDNDENFSNTGTWHGPFFSPDFEVLTANEIYREKENEFDVETSSSSKEKEVEKVTNAIEDGERVDVMNQENPESFVPVEVIQQEFTAKQKGHKDWDGKALKLWS